MQLFLFFGSMVKYRMNADYIIFRKELIMSVEKIKIPYGKQSIDETDIQAVIDVLHSDYLTTGPKSGEFEKIICEYTGAKYAVAVSNGTAALHAACYAAGIGAGDEVITTALTFAASANCVLYCGARPVFADVVRNTYNIDPQDILKKITNKTKAIIPVHLAGQPCDMEAIWRIANQYHLMVIEDAAHALGAKYKKQSIGIGSDMITFSFHPVKPITTGEGGMIVTNNKELYQKLKLFRSHCITREADMMQNPDHAGSWFYEQVDLGYNYRMTDIQAALGISQMKKIDLFLNRRKQLATVYNAAFENHPNIVLPYQAPWGESGWHLYMIQILHRDRKEVFNKMREAGIGVNVHYIPVYKHPYYQRNGFKNCICPNAEKIYSRLISLPLYPDLKDDEQQYVIKTLKQILNDTQPK